MSRRLESYACARPASSLPLARLIKHDVITSTSVPHLQQRIVVRGAMRSLEHLPLAQDSEEVERGGRTLELVEIPRLSRKAWPSSRIKWAGAARSGRKDVRQPERKRKKANAQGPPSPPPRPLSGE